MVDKRKVRWILWSEKNDEEEEKGDDSGDRRDETVDGIIHD